LFRQKLRSVFAKRKRRRHISFAQKNIQRQGAPAICPRPGQFRLETGVEGFLHSIRDQEVDDEFIKLAKERNVWFTPNLGGINRPSLMRENGTPAWFDEPLVRETISPALVRERAEMLIRGLQRLTSGGILFGYMLARQISAAFGLQLGGHPQFIRPLIAPMAEAAAARDGMTDEGLAERVKATAAAAENVGNLIVKTEPLRAADLWERLQLYLLNPTANPTEFEPLLDVGGKLDGEDAELAVVVHLDGRMPCSAAVRCVCACLSPTEARYSLRRAD
jgi:hypothetical protein